MDLEALGVVLLLPLQLISIGLGVIFFPPEQVAQAEVGAELLTTLR
jgi:hypothetical protein